MKTMAYIVVDSIDCEKVIGVLLILVVLVGMAGAVWLGLEHQNDN
jgi:hypothetical protein